ncbi:MAG: CPBP family intramembrane glutamic endopeptidase [Armatimonadota bacterium]
MFWRNLWYDPTSNRLRSGWRVLAFLAMALLFFLLLALIFSAFLPEELLANKDAGPYLEALIFQLAAIPALIAAGVWALRAFDRLPSRTLGISPEGKWLPQLLLGLAVGIGMIVLVMGVLWASGSATIRWQSVEKGALLLLAGSAVFMLLVGLAEELLFRGYLFQTLLRGIGPLLTLFFTSILFAAFHLGNPNWTLLSLTNIFVFGVLFGLLYLRSGSLWLPIGLHAGWNFAQVLFHVPVSGSAIPFPTPFMVSLTGPRLIAGGDFGPEGGVVVSAVGLAVIALVTYCRCGFSFESRWWEWRGFTLTPDMPQNWDFSIGKRHYQWKLLGHDQSE